MNDRNIIDLNTIVNDLKSLLDSIYDNFSSIRLIKETFLDDLVTFIMKKRSFFYSNIYICSHEYDELVGEVTRIFR